MLRRLAFWYLRKTEPKEKVESWNEAPPEPFVRVRLGAGNSCEVRQEFTMPGQWAVERVGTYEYRTQQEPTKKIWRCIGVGVIE